MCGIAGIFDLYGERAINQDALARMSDALIHRGPDGHGTYIIPGLGLAHRRLSIIDLEGGTQPFHSKTRPGALCFNGEIYNYQELRKNLRANNIPLTTQSDTEAIAEGMAIHSTHCLKNLRGMFAFAYWNEVDKTLTLARDRLGEKPLYYACTNDGFLLFASEIGAILAANLINPEKDNQAIADYFQYGYVPDPKSIYKHIQKIPPGHFLCHTQGCKKSSEFICKPYWRLSYGEKTPTTYHQACEELDSVLDDAVHHQMISDVPLGAFLSGGVDSSAIVSSMARKQQQAVTCSIGFDEASHDERKWARMVSEQYQTHHHEDIARLDVISMIGDIAKTYGEPFADSSALPTWMVSKLARQYVTVALSGDGGDEVFAGYRRYPFALQENRARRFLPHSIRKPIFSIAGKYYPKLDNFPRPLRFKTTFQAMALNFDEAYARSVSIMLPERAASLLSEDFKSQLSGYDPSQIITNHMQNADSDDPLDKALYTDCMTWLPGRMLTKTDRASMAHSLEVRPPLLDYKLVEWAARLPSSFKLEKYQGKKIFKDALNDRLPKDLLYRKKQGFGLPVSNWLRAEKKNPLERLQHSNHWRESGIINHKRVEEMIQQHKNQQIDYGQELWSVIMFDAFLAL